MSRPRFHLSLRQRIYLSMLTLILLSFLGSGVTAYFNFKQQEEEYNMARLSRKELAIQESMRYFLEQTGEGYMTTEIVPILFSDKICELADVHNLAINMYNLRGDLLISSSPQNVDMLGFPMKIDYTIMKQLSTGNSRAEMAKDIDHGTYIMAYWYYRDIDGKPIAITNVRYDKSEIDTNELNQFLIQLTRIYVVLFLGAALLAYVISNYITSSLQKIGLRLQRIDLSKHNEPISWSSNDEIGTLVKEYNRMLSEVEKSAYELAKTEREGAWREMAKQVAHEIKNPLTPMKLRVQHLQRSWDPDDPDYKAKLDAFSQSMIEQINALSAIASEFSDFAKMPKAKNEKINLVDVIESCIDLFGQPENASINYEPSDEKEAFAFVDRDQLLRVLNNLITNALQAIPDDQEGKVHVSLTAKEKHYQIKVKDNGTGIKEDMRSKIFWPNFTTKSTGTGLGLAMVKNIVENANGEIYFETQEGKGTTFFIDLPKYSDN